MKFIIILAVIAFIVYQLIQHKKDKEREREKAEERAKIIAERKKGGNPITSTALPEGAAAYAEYKGDAALLGADGKEYPNSNVHLDQVAIANLYDRGKQDSDQFEYSPFYGMLALEYYVKEIEERIQKYGEVHETDADCSFKAFYELGESYYYPLPGNDDLLHYMHYEARFKKDWLRAMQGNGYYKNAYDFPIDASKALQWFELSDAWFAKYREKVIGKGEATAIKMAFCKLQAAHILSAGLYGVAKDTKQAKALYNQAFELAQHYSQEEISVEVICAMIQGYPRNPEDYFVTAVNMMSDWACRSNLGLVMLIEYTQYGSKLDQKKLAESPESLVELCFNNVEENLYAGYLLAMALLCGYGMERNTESGMRILRLAAESGSVFAAYALWQLASDDPKEQETCKKALDSLVDRISSQNGHIRDRLVAEGKNITDDRKAQIRERLEEEAEQERREAEERYAEALKAQEEDLKFSFPAVIHDAELHRWELGSVYFGVARYECMDTGAVRYLDRLNIERLSVTQGIEFD